MNGIIRFNGGNQHVEISLHRRADGVHRPAGDVESHQRDTVSVDFYREVFHVTHFPGDSGNDLNTLSVSAAAGGRRRPTGPTLRSCMRFPSCAAPNPHIPSGHRSEEHTSELQSLMRISYAVFCLQKKNKNK